MIDWLAIGMPYQQTNQMTHTVYASLSFTLIYRYTKTSDQIILIQPPFSLVSVFTCTVLNK